MTFNRFARLAPLAAVVAAGCFATRNDVRLLQADISRLQAAQTAAEEAAAHRGGSRTPGRGPARFGHARPDPPGHHGRSA